MKVKQCPEFGQAILPYYEDAFESGFIILQPFTKYNEKDKHYFENDQYPKSDEILNILKIVSWSEIIYKFSFTNIEQLNFALLSWFGALKKNDENFAKKVASIFLENNIFEPSNGLFDEFLFQTFITIFKDEGYKTVIFADDFFDKVEEVEIEKAKNQENFQFAKNIYSPEGKILFTIHWDSFFVIFLGSKEIVNRYKRKYKPEGFWCKQDTEVFWSRQIANKIF